MTAGADRPASRADEARLADEVRLVRGSAAVVPVDRQVVLVEGPDAASFLQGQCSQDVFALPAGASADALLLSPQGKLQALVRISRLNDEGFVVDVDSGYAQTVVARLLQFRLRVKVEVTELPWRCVSVRGPDAAGLVGGVGDGTAVVAPVSWNGVVGADLVGSAPLAPAGVPVVGSDAWQAVRVEAGIPVMGAELDERTIAAEAGLVERAVSFTKGCYTGQELVARLDARGNRVARRLLGVVVDDGDGAPSAGDVLVVGDREVGRLTSVAWSPTLGRPVALAYVHRTLQAPAPVSVVPGTERDGERGEHGEGGGAEGSRGGDDGTAATSAPAGAARRALGGEVRELPLVAGG